MVAGVGPKLPEWIAKWLAYRQTVARQLTAAEVQAKAAVEVAEMELRVQERLGLFTEVQTMRGEVSDLWVKFRESETRNLELAARNAALIKENEELKSRNKQLSIWASWLLEQHNEMRRTLKLPPVDLPIIADKDFQFS